MFEPVAGNPDKCLLTWTLSTTPNVSRQNDLKKITSTKARSLEKGPIKLRSALDIFLINTDIH